METEVLVLGGGPGGYSAAFRASDLGQSVLIVEADSCLGGVCLRVGCIPSKALLHQAKLIEDTKNSSQHGIHFASPKIDLDALRAWKDSVVERLTKGLAGLAKQRKVKVVHGIGHFISANQLCVVKPDKSEEIITFKTAIIAVGSHPVRLPFLPVDPKIMDSTKALELMDVPERMLVIGGGIIGLEMATVYHALGSKITIAELSHSLLPGVELDLLMPLQKRLQMKYEKISLATKVTSVEVKENNLLVTLENADGSFQEKYNRILVAVGRASNGNLINAKAAGVNVDEYGFIAVDNQQKTNVDHIYAIGDVTGNPMLAHKAIPQGRIAAEVIAGKQHYFDPICIPNVAYTDPEIAWIGMTENEIKAANIPYEKAVFPWNASGRALSMGREEGLTRLLIDKRTDRILGAGIVGVHAGDLIAEIALAIEMGSEAEDLALTIHAHPTLAETIPLAAEMYTGTITDLYFPKK